MSQIGKGAIGRLPLKGYQYQKGQYVALSDEDFRQANVKATQTVDIQQFVDQASVPPDYFETPYHLSPTVTQAHSAAQTRGRSQTHDFDTSAQNSLIRRVRT